MLFKVVGSKRTVKRDIPKYLVDWDKKVIRGKHFGQLQFDVKQLLRPHWEKHIVCEEFPIPARKYERGQSVDFINFTTRQVIEVQGKQHTEIVDYFHTSKYKFFAQLKRDDHKEAWSNLNGFDFFEIYQEDELNDDLLKKLGII
jgi:hypothetical protein